MSEEVEEKLEVEDISKCPVCGNDTSPKIFSVENFEIHGAECANCNKTFLKGEDVKRFAEYKKGATAADRVIC